jgi:hypothetical protein
MMGIQEASKIYREPEETGRGEMTGDILETVHIFSNELT